MRPPGPSRQSDRAGERSRPLGAFASLIVFIALLAPQLAAASWETEHLIRVWETADGLPQNSVIAIAQTRDGYLWFGTFNGLARFDGVRFEVFDPSNSALNSRAIQSLHGDSEGRLWILTVERDLFVLNDGEMAAVSFDQGARPALFGMQPVIETPEGDLLTVATSGVALWDGRQFVDAMKRLRIPPGGRQALAVSGGRTWAASGPALGLIANGRFEPRFDLRTVDGSSVHIMIPSADGGLWIMYSSKESMFCFRLRLDSVTGSLVPEGPSIEGALWCILEDRHRTLWGGSDGHGLVVKPATGSATNLTTRHGLSHSQVRSAFEDREGNIWLGTDGGGVMRIKQRLFQTFDRAAGFVDEVVYSVAAGNGGLEVATYSSGFYHLDPATGLAKHHPLQRPTGRAVLVDRAQTLWAGTFESGLHRMRAGLWEPVNLPPTEAPSAYCLFEDRSGTVWAGGSFGVGFWDGEKMQPVRLSETNKVSAVCALAEDREGTMWAATRENGLFAIRNKVVLQFTTRDGLPSDRLLSVMASANGELWLGTEDHGLARFSGGRFFGFGVQNGLAARAICWLIEDPWERIWMGSYRGVHVAAKKDLAAFANGLSVAVRSFVYGLEDGLKALESTVGSQPGACQTPDGKIWFGTIKGLACVDPARVTPGAEPPPVQIEEVSVDREVVYSNLPRSHRGHRDRERRIILPASYRVLEIRYTGLNLGGPEQTLFRHRMSRFDREWVMADRQRVATYPKLRPGEHRFEVTAASRDGPWNPAAASIMVQVLPYWWETGGFRGGAVVAVAGLAAAGIRWNTRREVRRSMEEAARRQAIAEERARISRDMHDGLGSKLTQVSLLARTLDEATRHEANTRETACRISAISRELLQRMSEVVWAVDPKHDNLEDLAEHMVVFAQEHLSLAGIMCQIDFPLKVPHRALSPKWRHEVLMVFKEAIQNAVKHSGAKRVTVRMDIGDRIMRLAIEDDGNGLPAVEKRGHGLDNMRNRIASLHGKIVIESEPGNGTRVRASVPLAQLNQPAGVRPANGMPHVSRAV